MKFNYAIRRFELIERNKYAPWGRGPRPAASLGRAPYVWRKGNGKFDKKPAA